MSYIITVYYSTQLIIKLVAMKTDLELSLFTTPYPPPSKRNSSPLGYMLCVIPIPGSRATTWDKGYDRGSENDPQITKRARFRVHLRGRSKISTSLARKYLVHASCFSLSATMQLELM